MRSARRWRVTRLLIPVVGLVLIAGAAPALAQETETTTPRPDRVQITTPFAGVAVEPGSSATFSITVNGPIGDRVALSLEGLPEGWTGSLRGGGFEVSQVVVEEIPPVIDLEVEVPEDAEEGDYELTVAARADSGNTELPIELRLAAAAGGSVELTTDSPELRDSADTTFSFDLDLTNDTPREVSFQLQAAGPEGWFVEARPATDTQAATLTVPPGESGALTVEVRPNPAAPAETYPILVQAVGGGQTVETELAVTITGSYALTLTTPDEVLNAEATAGQATEVALLVLNEGTSPLLGVELTTGTVPTGWDVTFSELGVTEILPGESAQVTATITPSGEALAGDYRLTVNASAPDTDATDELELRVTVNTSALWGLVGVGVIVLAFAGLAWVFRRYGRR